MKKYLFLIVALAAVSAFSAGCSSMGGCWSRNGSRVPVQSSYPAATANVYPAEQVVYSSPANSCDPCTPNACDPCGTGSTAAGYPSANQVMPGGM